MSAEEPTNIRGVSTEAQSRRAEFHEGTDNTFGIIAGTHLYTYTEAKKEIPFIDSFWKIEEEREVGEEIEEVTKRMRACAVSISGGGNECQ